VCGEVIRAAQDVTIARSRPEVFDYVVDTNNLLDWNSAALSCERTATPGPIGRGSRFHGSFKGYGDVDVEIAEYDRPNRFAMVSATKAGRFRHTISLTLTPGGTRLEQGASLEPKGLSRLMAPIVGILIRRQFRRDNARLKQVLESAVVSSQA
jgi:uncharacterized protein YndB with AHSA1/START domain